MTTWGEKGRQLTNQLEGVTDEGAIKALAIAALNDIYDSSDSASDRTNALKLIAREILKKFPRKEEQTESYYHDPSGKVNLPKWRHLVFKYLTLERSDWDAVGGEQKKEWKQSQQPETQQPETQQPETQQPETQRAKIRQSKTRQSKPQSAKSKSQPENQGLKAMTIEQLELDTDTQAILANALEHSGMALDEFIKQAIKVYAKTVTGKAKQLSEDLANIPTQDLLNNPKYNTHPARAEELTKRAIRAIKFFNANKATENADRWMITQSAIASLTGSRQGTIKQILEQFKDDIDSHNQTYGLNPYSNRKPGKDITEIINLSELVPNGVD